MINDHRQWLYKGKEGRIFEKGEEIPEGYFDAPNATEWDNPPDQPVMKNVAVWEEPTLSSDDAPEYVEPKKYPSQMNKDELIEHGRSLGLSFDEGMTNREMREAIKTKEG